MREGKFIEPRTLAIHTRAVPHHQAKRERSETCHGMQKPIDHQNKRDWWCATQNVDIVTLGVCTCLVASFVKNPDKFGKEESHLLEELFCTLQLHIAGACIRRGCVQKCQPHPRQIPSAKLTSSSEVWGGASVCQSIQHSTHATAWASASTTAPRSAGSYKSLETHPACARAMTS